MAWKIAFLDGFEHYTAPLDKWDWRVGLYANISTVQARTGSRSLVLTCGTTARSYLGKALNVQAKSVCVGFALQPAAGGSGTDVNDILLQVKSGDITCATVVFNSANKFDLHLHYIGGTKITGTKTLTQGVWYYIELELLIDDTAGAYRLKIDGVQEFTGTAVDTAGSTDQFADRVYFWNKLVAGESDLYVDDVYMNASTILETQGTGFVGDVEVRTVLADADGSNADFTRSGGTTDVENVDETLINDDTDYLHSVTAGHQVTLNLADVTLEADQSIVAVQACMGLRKADAGFREIKVMTKSGVTESLGAIQIASSTDYRFKTEIWDLDPNTAAAWTEAGFNAAEFGVELQ